MTAERAQDLGHMKWTSLEADRGEWVWRDADTVARLQLARLSFRIEACPEMSAAVDLVKVDRIYEHRTGYASVDEALAAGTAWLSQEIVKRTKLLEIGRQP